MAFALVIDTETAPMFGRKTEQPEPWSSLVYDLGGVVIDTKTGNIAESFSFAISETFADTRTMNSAYYAAKLPKYYEGMKYLGSPSANADSAIWNVVNFHDAMTHVRELVKKYNIHKAWAYNVKFDEAALNATTRYYSNGFAAYFLPYGVKWHDIWDYADCITGTKKYLAFVASHNLFTPKGNPKTSAEIVYAFITGNPEHVEKHTALSDATEEAAILIAARRKHSRKSSSKGQGWRKAHQMFKKMKD